MVNLRDYNIITPVESLAEYRAGGLYPIHIGDRFQDGRYQILNKLGFGGFSTVWAARDHHKNIIVSLKVIRAEHSENNQELRILQYIRKDTTQHPGHKYLPQLFDYFYEGSPGKKNLFLVLELLGPPISTVRENLPGGCFSLSRSRQISKQLLLAIDCLHSHRIVHGDIYEGNILFRLPDDYDLDLVQVRQGEISRKDGAPLEEGLPRYLVETLDFRRQFDKKEFQKLNHLQLIDFSSSFFDLEPPDTLCTPYHMASPELIFQERLTKSVDIWSLACTTYYFATGGSLFTALADKRDTIPQIHKVVGESSAHWLLTAFLKAVSDHIWEDFPDFSDYSDCEILEDALSKWWSASSQSSASDVEGKSLRALSCYLRKTLIVDPSKRATTKELQAEEWVEVTGCYS